VPAVGLKRVSKLTCWYRKICKFAVTIKLKSRGKYEKYGFLVWLLCIL